MEYIPASSFEIHPVNLTTIQRPLNDYYGLYWSIVQAVDFVVSSVYALWLLTSGTLLWSAKGQEIMEPTTLLMSSSAWTLAIRRWKLLYIGKKMSVFDSVVVEVSYWRCGSYHNLSSLFSYDHCGHIHVGKVQDQSSWDYTLLIDSPVIIIFHRQRPRLFSK